MTEPRLMQTALALQLVTLTIFATPASDQQKSGSHATNPKDHIPEITRKALPAVVLVVALDKSGKELGQGSGFLVSHDGKVVTNYHVIKDASSALIKSPNGAFYSIEGVLGVDRDRDVAVLKASGRDFQFLPLGGSASVRVGEHVIAIGSPLALEGTVSDGIVSAVRALKNGKLKVIQTTAPISPGSSGGALLNLKGQVIGVTAFHLVSGENLNFAIAADHVRPLLASNNVTAFEPTSAEANAKSKSEEPSQGVPEPVNLPRDWIDVESGGALAVRLEGDYLYEQASGSMRRGDHNENVNIVCETKRQTDGRWVGKCRHQIELISLDLLRQYRCNLELDEIITSVTPRRIEGESQTWAPPEQWGGCPSPLYGQYKHFAYIPRD